MQRNEKIKKLICKIKKGDKKAFNELYKLTSGHTYFFILKIVQNEQDAEDILQESYVKMLEKIDEIDPERNFTSWFYQIAINKSKDLLRRNNKVFFESIDNEEYDYILEESTEFYPEEKADKDELCAQVMTAIDELTAEKRACVIMKYYAQMNINEIAEILNVPTGTVKHRLFSARKDIKSSFEKLGKTAIYTAAPIGVIVWALNRSSLTVCAAFSASTASSSVMTALSSSVSTVSSSTATASTGVAAKLATMSVTQKIVAGTVAATLVGGSTVGTVSVIKNIVQQDQPTLAYTEYVTTSEQFSDNILYSETYTTGTTVETASQIPILNIIDSITQSNTKPTDSTTRPVTSSTIPPTTQVVTTTQPSTTAVTTTAPTTAVPPTEKPTETTTAEPQTTEKVTQAPATLIISVLDYDDTVVDTLTINVEAGTALTWDYLITLVSQNGYEAMAGIYGDGIDTAAQEGKTYTFEALL
ncbi:MAG: RNA polymerase sigma factor [Clostridia bacterium]|nr:RNA polymerase sigma factor [Clostridia bacterium]